ncbi:hypothetical protein MSM1_09615 [Mycobacterium sp. SM1]|uniref:hypothetical protein n=1 Tax=Mycobacterium sp. SM1 TaxID=2816243 RepID=UPI001BCEE561|nr:hypothetical protein [Mycobacterium sp. SM1]MBS4728578.1 hypothetical protein [Mycobacterium sp. SM1]
MGVEYCWQGSKSVGDPADATYAPICRGLGRDVKGRRQPGFDEIGFQRRRQLADGRAGFSGFF